MQNSGQATQHVSRNGKMTGGTVTIGKHEIQEHDVGLLSGRCPKTICGGSRLVDYVSRIAFWRMFVSACTIKMRSRETKSTFSSTVIGKGWVLHNGVQAVAKRPSVAVLYEILMHFGQS